MDKQPTKKYKVVNNFDTQIDNAKTGWQITTTVTGNISTSKK